MHEGLAGCSEFTRLLAIALLNWSDDEGYFMANPILIRGQVFPFMDDSKMIPRSLQDLSRVGWIALGKDDQGRDVGMVLNFSKHQRVDKPQPSKIKDCSQFQEHSKNDLGLIQDDSKEERKGKERNGEGKGKEKSLTLPFDSVAFQSAWIEWVEFRRSKKKPISEKAALRILADFAKWGESDSIEAIMTSIKNDWQGLFQPKASQSQKPKHAGIQEPDLIQKGF